MAIKGSGLKIQISTDATDTTYNDVNGDDPSKDCGPKYMEFSGEQRHDKGGGVPSYRNLTVTPSGSSFQIVDQFSTGQINARSAYTLRKLDADHIELTMQAGGKTIKLRRCE